MKEESVNFLNYYEMQKHCTPQLLLEDGKGWGAQKEGLKMPFSTWKNTEKSLKTPWIFWIKKFSGIFHGTTKNARKTLEKCLKNAWKPLDSKIRVFSNPPFYAPTLWHPLIYYFLLAHRLFWQSHFQSFHKLRNTTPNPKAGVGVQR